MFKHVPWPGSHAAEAEAKHADDKDHHGSGEASLTSLLDAKQRSELTILIVKATASMRKTIESNFDASVSHLGQTPNSILFPDTMIRYVPRQSFLPSFWTLPKMRKF